jgi:hypothetical protein
MTFEYSKNLCLVEFFAASPASTPTQFNASRDCNATTSHKIRIAEIAARKSNVPRVQPRNGRMVGRVGLEPTTKGL